MDMKLEQDPNNSTIFKFYTGVSWKNEDEVLFDDHQVVVFNHSNDTSLAALTTEFDAIRLPDLKESVRAQMDIMDIQLYERKQKEVEMMHDHMTEAFAAQDAYKNPLVVVDTDYSDFLILYKCREEERLPRDDDDHLPHNELYRQMVEEYSSSHHLMNA